MALLAFLVGQVPEGGAQTEHREQIIPILGVTDAKEPLGVVVYLVLALDVRDDTDGLVVSFPEAPGRLSPMAQTSVVQAIYRSARALGCSTDSWTVVLSLPYPGGTLYGSSLSAMVGLSVVALANGIIIPPDRVITGTITPEGRIGPVGSVPLKVTAANEAHLSRILVPDEQDVADGDWHTPFLVQVSPVGSVSQAYRALTHHPQDP